MQLQLHDRMHNEPVRTDYDNRVVGKREEGRGGMERAIFKQSKRNLFGKEEER